MKIDCKSSQTEIIRNQLSSNPESSNITLLKYLRYWLFTKRDKTPKRKILDDVLPVTVPDFDSQHPEEDEVKLTWIGHSTCVVRMCDIVVLTDPIFSKHAGPWSKFGPRRFRKAACKIKHLPSDLSIVMISHNHFDHLDFASVKMLHQRYGNKLTWFIPKGLKRWFVRMNVLNVVELNWNETHTFSTITNSCIKITCTSAQHSGGRSVFDKNTCICCGWCIHGPNASFYFAGDTGYNQNIFERIGQDYGPFTLAAIPVGAYSPRWLMKSHHLDVRDAVAVHVDVDSMHSVGIHWGTFRLSNESVFSPRLLLPRMMRAFGLRSEQFVTINHGESICVS